MKSRYRMPQGGLIDRAQPLEFSFDGQRIQAFAGDTIASALLAAGIRIVGRSFRLHRPRGVLSCGIEEPNALVHVRLGSYEEPNVRATLMRVRPGMQVFSQNVWPSRRLDFGAFFDWLPRLWSTGFYHKAFMWPSWHVYEPAIRRLAGLGRVRDAAALSGSMRQTDLATDVLVCGGGRAGVAAARAASASARVLLVDSGDDVAHGPFDVLPHTWAIGVFGSRTVLAVQEEGWDDRGPRRRLLRIRTKSLIVATGAIEQPLVFENNDRPGVMLAGAVTEYLQRFGVRAGERVCLVTNNDHAYQHADQWKRAGIDVARIIDSRRDTRTLRVLGRGRVRGVQVDRERIDCDLVAMSGGWAPAVHLFTQAGGELEYSKALRAYVPSKAPPGLSAVGRAAGHFDAAGVIGPTSWPGKAHRQWLDFQHDVTVHDAHSAVAQGYTHVEHFKRYTTTGMAVDQGKTSLRNALEVLASATGRSMEDLRPPTFRPPYAPISVGLAAGPNVGRWYRPERRLPCHDMQVAAHAHFDDMGGWARPLFYGPAERRAECTEEEIRTVRTAAGLFAASPLGKLEVSGPDALEFLNRMYVNDLRSLTEGNVRYVLMLRDNGAVMDDGTVTRTGPQSFLVTTTSGNAERVYLWMREWSECEWPDLQVLITPLTTAWGTVTVSGPRARDVLARAGTSIDLDARAFPHMTLRTGTVAGLDAHVHRVSFTGEVSFEINVAARKTGELWAALLAAGARPYGIDALNVLRTEKGYLHIGADTDAGTTPLDLGWGRMIAKKTGDFIGRSALGLPEYQRTDRLQLVGIVPAMPGESFAAGAHLVRAGSDRSEGFLTSACASPTLGHCIALARLEAGFQRRDEHLLAFDQGKQTLVRVVSPPFYDPGNLRLKG